MYLFSLCLLSQVDTYIADADTATTNRLIAQAYKEGLASGVFIRPTSLPHYVPDQKDMVLYKNRREGETDREKDGTENTPPHTKL